MRDRFLTAGVQILNMEVWNVCNGVKLQLEVSVGSRDYKEIIIGMGVCVCVCKFPKLHAFPTSF